MPFVNETGINGPVNMGFNLKDITDVDELNKHLKRCNLKHSIAVRPIPMVVIKDKK
jgi:hypothetical protein